jgi:hypothetical protein
MNADVDRSLAETLIGEHRRLDELFGRFLAAGQSGAVEPARVAIEAFDAELRRHTAFEEERLYPRPAGPHPLAPRPGESEEGRRTRELLLEHVQIRELSQIILRALTERQDLAAARALAGNLARRWDAHTTREEREMFGGLKF